MFYSHPLVRRRSMLLGLLAAVTLTQVTRSLTILLATARPARMRLVLLGQATIQGISVYSKPRLPITSLASIRFLPTSPRPTFTLFPARRSLALAPRFQQVCFPDLLTTRTGLPSPIPQTSA